LASSTKKREGISRSSLGLLLDFIIGLFIIFIVIVDVAIPSPMVFHNGRRIDYGVKGLKIHGSAHFALALLQVRKHLTHLLMRLSDKGVVGAAPGDESLEAIEKDVLFLGSTSRSSRGLRSRRRCMPTSRRNMCTGRRSTSRRRGMWSPNKLWLIRTMVSIILKLHVRLGVDDLLNVQCIDHIGGSML
jgi:hypothetical protein